MMLLYVEYTAFDGNIVRTITTWNGMNYKHIYTLMIKMKRGLYNSERRWYMHTMKTLSSHSSFEVIIYVKSIPYT